MLIPIWCFLALNVSWCHNVLLDLDSKDIFLQLYFQELKVFQRFTYQILVSNFWNDISKTALSSPSHSRNLFNMFGIIKKLTQSTIEDMITSGVRFVETNQQLTNNKSWPRFHSFAEKNKTKPWFCFKNISFITRSRVRQLLSSLSLQLIFCQWTK